MNITLVHFDMHGDGVAALYYDGDLVFSGDDYHNSIRDWLKGYFAALDHFSILNNKVVLDCWEVEGEHGVLFMEDGAPVPEQWPDKEWSPKAKKMENPYENRR